MCENDNVLSQESDSPLPTRPRPFSGCLQIPTKTPRHTPNSLHGWPPPIATCWISSQPHEHATESCAQPLQPPSILGEPLQPELTTACLGTRSSTSQPAQLSSSQLQSNLNQGSLLLSSHRTHHAETPVTDILPCVAPIKHPCPPDGRLQSQQEQVRPRKRPPVSEQQAHMPLRYTSRPCENCEATGALIASQRKGLECAQQSSSPFKKQDQPLGACSNSLQHRGELPWTSSPLSGPTEGQEQCWGASTEAQPRERQKALQQQGTETGLCKAQVPWSCRAFSDINPQVSQCDVSDGQLCGPQRVSTARSLRGEHLCLPQQPPLQFRSDAHAHLRGSHELLRSSPSFQLMSDAQLKRVDQLVQSPSLPNLPDTQQLHALKHATHSNSDRHLDGQQRSLKRSRLSRKVASHVPADAPWIALQRTLASPGCSAHPSVEKTLPTSTQTHRPSAFSNCSLATSYSSPDRQAPLLHQPSASATDRGARLSAGNLHALPLAANTAPGANSRGPPVFATAAPLQKQATASSSGPSSTVSCLPEAVPNVAVPPGLPASKHQAIKWEISSRSVSASHSMVTSRASQPESAVQKGPASGVPLKLVETEALSIQAPSVAVCPVNTGTCNQGAESPKKSGDSITAGAQKSDAEVQTKSKIGDEMRLRSRHCIEEGERTDKVSGKLEEKESRDLGEKERGKRGQNDVRNDGVENKSGEVGELPQMPLSVTALWLPSTRFAADPPRAPNRSASLPHKAPRGLTLQPVDSQSPELNAFKHPAAVKQAITVDRDPQMVESTPKKLALWLGTLAAFTTTCDEMIEIFSSQDAPASLPSQLMPRDPDHFQPEFISHHDPARQPPLVVPGLPCTSQQPFSHVPSAHCSDHHQAHAAPHVHYIHAQHSASSQCQSSLQISCGHPALSLCPSDVTSLQHALQPIAPAASETLAGARMTAALCLRAAPVDIVALGISEDVLPLILDVCAALCADRDTLSESEKFLLNAPTAPKALLILDDPLMSACADGVNVQRSSGDQTTRHTDNAVSGQAWQQESSQVAVHCPPKKVGLKPAVRDAVGRHVGGPICVLPAACIVRGDAMPGTSKEFQDGCIQSRTACADVTETGDAGSGVEHACDVSLPSHCVHSRKCEETYQEDRLSHAQAARGPVQEGNQLCGGRGNVPSGAKKRRRLLTSSVSASKAGRQRQRHVARSALPQSCSLVKLHMARADKAVDHQQMPTSNICTYSRQKEAALWLLLRKGEAAACNLHSCDTMQGDAAHREADRMNGGPPNPTYSPSGCRDYAISPHRGGNDIVGSGVEFDGPGPPGSTKELEISETDGAVRIQENNTLHKEGIKGSCLGCLTAHFEGKKQQLLGAVPQADVKYSAERHEVHSKCGGFKNNVVSNGQGSRLWEWAGGGSVCSAEAVDKSVADLFSEPNTAVDTLRSIDVSMVDPAAVYALDSQGRLCVTS
jgi:hypothetical protein